MADRLPTVASGARSSVAGIASTRLKVDMGDLYRYESDEGALFTTAAMLGKERATNKTVSWHTSELPPKFIRINNGAGYNTTDLTWTVDSPGGSYVNSGWLLKVTRTGETVLTTTGGSATSIVVATGARSWGPNAAAALIDNDEILIIGPAYAENAALGAAITVTETQYSNSIHTMRDNWSISGLMMEMSENGGTYEGAEPEIQRVDMLLKHKRNINLALLHGEAGTSGGTATTQGVTEFVLANAAGNTNSASTLTEPVWEGGNKTLFRAGQRKKIFIASRSVKGILNQFPGSVQRTTSGQSTYGLEITDYQSAYGKLMIITEIGFEGDKYDGYALGLDPKGVKFKYVRDTRMIKNRQGTSVDGYEEEVLTDFAGVWGMPDFHYLWTGITS